MVKKNESPRIGISDLEAKLKTSRQTITRWVKRGHFPAPHKLGQRRLWFVADVERFEAETTGLASGRHPAAREPDRARSARGAGK